MAIVEITAMSALGHKWTFAVVLRDVRYSPESGHQKDFRASRLWT